MIRVSRLTLRCVAPHAARSRALDVRARLERVATGPLVAALEAAFGPVDGNVRIDSLHVPLDLDPAEYDDDTLAVLWASRIAAAVTPRLPAVSWVDRLLALPPRDVASVAALLVARGVPDVPGEVRSAVLAALRAAARGAPRPGATPLAPPAPRPPAGPSRGGDPARAGAPPAPPARPVAPVPPDPADPTARGAPATDTPTAALPVPDAASKDAPPAGPPPAPDAAAPAPPPARGAGTASPDPWRAAAAAAPPTPSAAARAVADAAAGTAGTPLGSAAFLSAAGGLVLLYPWLGSCVPATTLADTDARRATYAALAGDPELQHDPLVRLLAGADPGEATPDVSLDVDPEPVLRAFAGMLPGFESSSTAYLQEHLIRRVARVDPVGDVVLVRLEAKPLDVVLRALPYPLGVLRLAWTPPLAVELRC